MSVLLNSSTMEAECPDRIQGWLEKLDIRGYETDKGEGDEIAQDEKAILGPITPRRQSKQRPTLDEISPTDTSFSERSIFDVLHRRNLFGSPTPKCEIREDNSDMTSIGSIIWAPMPKNEHILERLALPNFSLVPSVPPASLDSHDSPSDTDANEPTAVLGQNHKFTHLTQDLNGLRPVWITSCLQCTLAGLSCSRTYPSCSRCKRSDRAEVCLLQCRCFISEALDRTELGGCKVPLLLKVRGEDERLRKRKTELAKELCEKWVAEQEKKNWVLPDIGSPRGGWRARKDKLTKGKVLHPGEGIGRLSFHELFVDMEA